MPHGRGRCSPAQLAPSAPFPRPAHAQPPIMGYTAVPMRLRTQVIFAVAISFSVLATLLLSVNGILATQRFQQLEDREVADQVDRLRSILAQEDLDLAAKLSDWSVWDDAWKYLSGTNPDFPKQQ